MSEANAASNAANAANEACVVGSIKKAPETMYLPPEPVCTAWSSFGLSGGPQRAENRLPTNNKDEGSSYSATL